MAIVVLNLVVGLLLAYGGTQEAIVRGILGGERASFLVGIAGTLVSLLLSISGVALWRGWRRARELTLVACVLVAVFCALAALPPRYVGIPALLVGVGYPVAVISHLMRGGGRDARACADRP
jgi:hypothetical protein